ncbi:hypothetical protein SDC9_70545 [bioreactor metagenome]|uniref:Uncharacterized protein n=1 Tax=bioreactor metagenome TaxID=1076179 RepID=A0A644YD47_9ZZZZ
MFPAIFGYVVENPETQRRRAHTPAADQYVGMLLPYPADHFGIGPILIVLPGVAERKFEIGDDDRILRRMAQKRLNQPVLRIGAVGFIVDDPFVVGEEMGPPAPRRRGAVLSERDRRNVGKAETEHRIASVAVFLAGLGRPLPERVFAGGQRPAGGKPAAFVKIVAQPVDREMKPFRQADPLFAAEADDLLIGFFDFPRHLRIVQLHGDAERQARERLGKAITGQRPFAVRPHIDVPALGAARHLIALPGPVAHGQPVLADRAVHRQLSGVIVNAVGQLRPDFHAGGLSFPGRQDAGESRQQHPQHHTQSGHRRPLLPYNFRHANRKTQFSKNKIRYCPM